MREVWRVGALGDGMAGVEEGAGGKARASED